MQKLDLLSSLINPAPVAAPEAAPLVEMQAPTNQPTPMTVTDVERNREPTPVGEDQFEVPFDVFISYDLNGEKLSLTAEVNVLISLDREDDSFDYEYGSERGTHPSSGVGADFTVDEVILPQEEFNYDLYRLPPETMQEVTTAIVARLKTYGEAEFGKFVDVDSIISTLASH